MFNLTELLTDIEAMARDNPKRCECSILRQLQEEHSQKDADAKPFTDAQTGLLLRLTSRILRSQQPRTGDATANG